MIKNLQSPIDIFEIGGYCICHGEQNTFYLVKENNNNYVSETGVKSDLAFCLRPFVEKTNSVAFDDKIKELVELVHILIHRAPVPFEYTVVSYKNESLSSK